MDLAMHTVTSHASRRWSTMERAEYVERYNRLSEQSELIRSRLFTTPTFSDDPFSPADNMSPDQSPMQRSRTSSSTASHAQTAYSFPSTQAWPNPQSTPAGSTSDEEQQLDEASLCEINHQIKAVLTELLNCEEVKADKGWRTWTQARLMDAEHELKRQRRRRSSAATAQEIARTISSGIGVSPVRTCTASF